MSERDLLEPGEGFILLMHWINLAVGADNLVKGRGIGVGRCLFEGAGAWTYLRRTSSLGAC